MMIYIDSIYNIDYNIYRIHIIDPMDHKLLYDIGENKL